MNPSLSIRNTIALAVATLAFLGCASSSYAADLSAIQREVGKRHDEARTEHEMLE